MQIDSTIRVEVKMVPRVFIVTSKFGKKEKKCICCSSNNVQMIMFVRVLEM